jgi:hypothetical protein
MIPTATIAARGTKTMSKAAWDVDPEAGGLATVRVVDACKLLP